MRLKLFLRLLGPRNRLNFNYAYYLSSWMYKVLAQGDQAFATWLHDQGYRLEGRQFRLFSFSQLDARPFSIQGNCLQFNGPGAWLELGFCVHEAAGHFLQGLFEQQTFTLGDVQQRVEFQVESVEILPTPTFTDDWQQCRALGPICASLTRGPGEPVEYLAPDHPCYVDRLHQNLHSKWLSYQQTLGLPATEPEGGFDLRVTSRPQSRLIAIAPGTERETKVRGFLYDFELRCPAPWKRFLWQTGLGEKNSMGFGLFAFR